MPPIDNPLKQLFNTFPIDFASWLLGAPVVDATPLNVELPADSLNVDQLYEVRLNERDGQASSNRDVLLHIEFQGRRSREPMPLRMLVYMARLTAKYQRPVTSVVLYVGQGAGTGDTGIHTMQDALGETNLSWRYRVIRLWDMDARELLAASRPALLALIGQCRITQAETLLPEVLTQVRTVTSPALRSRLLNSLFALYPIRGTSYQMRS